MCCDDPGAAVALRTQKRRSESAADVDEAARVYNGGSSICEVLCAGAHRLCGSLITDYFTVKMNSATSTFVQHLQMLEKHLAMAICVCGGMEYDLGLLLLAHRNQHRRT